MDSWPEPPATDGDGSEQRTVEVRRIVLIALAIGLCMVVAGVSIAVFSSPGSGHAGRAAGAVTSPVVTAPATQPTAPVASSRATPSPGVASDGHGKSVLRWPPGRTRQILRWDAGPGGKTLAAVGEQMGTAMQSAGLKLYAPMRLACIQLASDISTAQAGPPIPDAAMQQLYARALTGLSHAAADCRAAITMEGDGEDLSAEVHGSLLTRSRAEFAAASAKLYRATGEVDSLHR
jgi:hypothetical protein